MFGFNYSIAFNGQDSKDLGLNVEQRPNFPTPERNVVFTDIEGRNGSLMRDLGTYKNIQVSINFNLINLDNISDQIRSVKKWLIGNIYDNKLILSDDTEYFYKVVNVKIDNNIERIMKVGGKFSALFTCEPFQYSVDGENVTTFTATPSILNNFGSYNSAPIIKIYGTGTIDLFVNNSHIILNNVVDYVTIDSQANDCYKDTVNMNNNMIGDFPVLVEGINNISWTGTVTKVEIAPGWRYL